MPNEPKSVPYGDTGEDDMDAPGMTPPSKDDGKKSMPHGNLDYGSATTQPSDTMLLLGAGKPYGSK